MDRRRRLSKHYFWILHPFPSMMTQRGKRNCEDSVEKNGRLLGPRAVQELRKIEESPEDHPAELFALVAGAGPMRRLDARLCKISRRAREGGGEVSLERRDRARVPEVQPGREVV